MGGAADYRLAPPEISTWKALTAPAVVRGDSPAPGAGAEIAFRAMRHHNPRSQQRRQPAILRQFVRQLRAFAALIRICLGGCGSAAPTNNAVSSVPFKIGDTRLQIGCDPDFVVLGEQVPAFRKVLQSRTPQNDLHAILVEPADLARTLAGAEPEFGRFMSVESVRAYTDQTITTADFDSICQKFASAQSDGRIKRNMDIV